MDFNRKVMITSVSVLGISLSMFLFAYMVFGDNTDEDLRTLRQTNIIFRHGAKYPDTAYEKDSHLQDVKNVDQGRLSLNGSYQMFSLGENLRHRYLKLLPSNGFYTSKMIEVKSSWMDRTISSALSFLASFMRPIGTRNPLSIPWQPVPVHSIARNLDDIIAQKRACPKYDEVYKDLMNSKEIQSLNMNKTNLYRILSINTGSNISNLHQVEALHNVLEAEVAAGWALPDWTENIFPKVTLPLAERYLRLLTETPFMKRIKGGPLVTEIIENMEGLKLETNQRTITIYSGHDVTLVNVMNSLGILDQTSAKPAYSAALAIELHHSLDHDDEMDVKMYYYFSCDDKYPKKIDIPECPSPCALTRFKKVMNGILVNDFERLCELV